MSVTDNNRNGSGGLPTSVEDPAEPIVEAPLDAGSSIATRSPLRSLRPELTSRESKESARVS